MNTVRNVSAMVDIADTHSTADRGLPGTTTNPQVPDGNLERDVTGYRRTDPDGVAWATDAGDRRTSLSAPAARRSAAGTRYLPAAIRLALGRIFLRAFLDKTFGLGHDTAVATLGLNGGSPTKGFPGSAAQGAVRRVLPRDCRGGCHRRAVHGRAPLQADGAGVSARVGGGPPGVRGATAQRYAASGGGEMNAGVAACVAAGRAVHGRSVQLPSVEESVAFDPVSRLALPARRSRTNRWGIGGGVHERFAGARMCGSGSVVSTGHRLRLWSLVPAYSEGEPVTVEHVCSAAMAATAADAIAAALAAGV